MTNQKLYDAWAASYDRQENKTRDLEKIAARQTLAELNFATVIELGCGTGKNTVWLAERARRVVAVDFSEEMQKFARQKIKSENVHFVQADITKNWDFAAAVKFDLITSSLVLEHVADLRFIFREAFQNLGENGHFYVCELHPFRQYIGSKARFETADGTQILECFTHHVSNYAQAAMENGFSLALLNEWFDDGDEIRLPRLISFLFKRI